MDITSYILGLQQGKSMGGDNGGGTTDKVVTKYTFSFTPTSGEYWVNHNWGVIPDLVTVVPTRTPATNKIFLSIGISRAMNNLGMTGASYLNTTGGGLWTQTCNFGIEDSAEDDAYMGVIREATTSGFRIGGSTGTVDTNVSYTVTGYSGIA